MGDSTEWMVNKEKQAVRKLSEAVLAEGWKRCVETRRTRASFRRGPGVREYGWSKDYSDRLLALLHLNGDRIGGRDKIVVLRGTFHGDLVRPLAQALKLPFKTFLILIVHVRMDMRSLGALGQVVLQLKAVADLVPVLGRRDHHLRPILYWWFSWFILCEDWRPAETAH